jgi:hypothetical protein
MIAVRQYSDFWRLLLGPRGPIPQLKGSRPMNVLPFDQQVAVISALTEGCSIRSVERLTGVHRDTIMRLAARVGFGAIKFHDRTVHSLQVPRLELVA